MNKNIFNDMKIKKVSSIDKNTNIKILREDDSGIPMPKQIRRQQKEVEYNDVESNIIKNEEEEENFFNKEPVKKISTINSSKPTNFKGILLVMLILSIVLGGGYFIATYFEGAVITLIAKHQSFTFDHESFVAKKGSEAALPFEIIILNDKTSKDIVLTESQEMSSKAIGTVVIYNEYNTKPQKLPINASLTDDANRVYKINKQVLVPGYTLVKGKIVPGSIEVGITASIAGDEYNGDPRDFSIVLLKGTDRYKKIYARSKTSLAGGALGLIYTPSGTEKGNLDAYALSVFKVNMIKKMNAQVPPGYILYPNAQTFSYQVDNNLQSKTPNIKANITGTLSAVILNKDSLAKAVIKHSLPDIEDSEMKEVSVPDLSKTTFDFVNEGQVITKDLQSITFTLTGKFESIWNPDIEILKTNLVSVSKDSVSSIFKQDPGIVSAKVVVRPPWQSYLPSDISKIKIIIQ